MLDVVWLNLVELSKQKTFREILSTVTSTEKEWKKWFDSDAPEEEDIPCGYQVHFHLMRTSGTISSHEDTISRFHVVNISLSGCLGCVSETAAHPVLLP